VIAMFLLWYDSDDQVIIDEEEFCAYFEKALTKGKVKWNRVPSKTQYNRSQGAFKYKFSSVRLTKKGFELYLPLIPEHTNNINREEEQR
jgi:hypothetical protein